MALIVKSKLKELTELSVADEFYRDFEKKVEEMFKKAEERAKANFRRTIFPRDI